MDSPLLTKSKQFALDIIKVCNKVKSEKMGSVLTNQLIRSGTSIGANIWEAFYGHGKNDFIAKLQIALKECSESEYWIWATYRKRILLWWKHTWELYWIEKDTYFINKYCKEKR